MEIENASDEFEDEYGDEYDDEYRLNMMPSL